MTDEAISSTTSTTDPVSTTTTSDAVERLLLTPKSKTIKKRSYDNLILYPHRLTGPKKKGLTSGALKTLNAILYEILKREGEHCESLLRASKKQILTPETIEAASRLTFTPELFPLIQKRIDKALSTYEANCRAAKTKKLQQQSQSQTQM